MLLHGVSNTIKGPRGSDDGLVSLVNKSTSALEVGARMQRKEREKRPSVVRRFFRKLFGSSKTKATASGVKSASAASASAAATAAT